jgi:RNA polymerase sigma-70 factor (ECF subfamily)
MASDEVSMDGSPSMQTLFEQVYENHYQVLYAYFVGRTADTEAAQDLLQETFLRVWRHRQSLPERTDEQQRAWLFAIARNLLTDYYRHRATRSAVEDEVAPSALPSLAMQDDMDAQVEEREYVALLDSAIKRLPEDLRTVLVLAVLAEMSSTEMSAVLGKPAGTIRYQLAKARKYLADELQRFAPSPPRKE